MEQQEKRPIGRISAAIGIAALILAFFVGSTIVSNRREQAYNRAIDAIVDGDYETGLSILTSSPPSTYKEKDNLISLCRAKQALMRETTTMRNDMPAACFSGAPRRAPIGSTFGSKAFWMPATRSTGTTSLASRMPIPIGRSTTESETSPAACPRLLTMRAAAAPELSGLQTQR